MRRATGVGPSPGFLSTVFFTVPRTEPVARGGDMIRLSQRVGYWSAAACPCPGLHAARPERPRTARGRHATAERRGVAGQPAERSVSLIDGYSGKVGSQVGLPGIGRAPPGSEHPRRGGGLRPLRAPREGLQRQLHHGSPIRLFGGAPTTAAGQDALYAVDELGRCRSQRLERLGPSARAAGPADIGRRAGREPRSRPGWLALCRGPGFGLGGARNRRPPVTFTGVGQRGDDLALVTAGTLPVAADLTRGTWSGWSGKVIGRTIHLPVGSRPIR